MGFLMLSHPLTNFEIQKYCKDEPRFNGVFSRNNLHEYNSIEKLKDETYIINLDEYANVATQWIALFCKKKMKLFISIVLVLNIFLNKLKILLKNSLKELPGNKNIKTNIFQIQEDNSIMCGYFCIGFMDVMLTGKKLTDYTNLFSPYDFKKNDSIILSYFKNE